MLRVELLSRHYGDAVVFDDVTLEIGAGEIVALLGESGAGKSTLLNCIAGLDRATSGAVRFGDVDVARLDDAASARWRREHLGFVFQAFHVLPHLTVGQNVSLPLLLLSRPDASRVAEMLAATGLAGFDDRAPRTLSGGQLQRVAIARALVHRPSLLLADEPTGNLDPLSAERILSLLFEQARSGRAACLLATHSAAAAARADRTLRITTRGIVPG